MAQFTKKHGNAQQVFQPDTLEPVAGSASYTSVPINVAGPKLDFFKIATGVDIRLEGDHDEAVEIILQAIQQLGTVACYQVQGTSAGNMSVAVYATEDWKAATMQTAIRALGATVGTNSIDLSATTVTQPGMELA
jgi:hypothetical protein